MNEVAAQHKDLLSGLCIIADQPGLPETPGVGERRGIREIKRTNWMYHLPVAKLLRFGGWRATWAGEGGGVLLNQSPTNLILADPDAQTGPGFCAFGKYHQIEVEDDDRLCRI